MSEKEPDSASELKVPSYLQTSAETFLVALGIVPSAPTTTASEWLLLDVVFNSNEEQHLLAKLDKMGTFLFGDFTSDDHERYFAKDGVQNVGVEFICDFYNTSRTWVEDCSKQRFDELEMPNYEESGENYEQTVKDNIYSNEKDNSLNKYQENHAENINTNVKQSVESTKTNVRSNSASSDGANNEVININDKTKNTIPKPSSWASLFKANTEDNSLKINTDNKTKETAEVFSVQMEEVIEKNNDTKLSLIAIENDSRAKKLAEFISTLSPVYTRHHLQLRGLINRGNWCYINTVLQALHGISPLSHFYKSLKMFLNKKVSTSTPITDCMISFFNEFEPINPKVSLKKQSEDLKAGSPFEPKNVYDVLPVMKTSLSEKGRQEDAEEFLSFLLNGIHEELVTLFQLHAKTSALPNGNTHGENYTGETSDGDSDGESWEHVGKKNKSSTVRKAVIEESFIKEMFGGVIRSSVHQTGAKESTTLQPFFTLQLDIQSEKVQSLTDALEACFTKESLQGFTCSKTNAEVEASRRTSIEELPSYFIFHLKYFVFDRKGGCQKLHKHIEIPVDLEIPKDVLSPTIKNKAGSIRNYKLYAVVYHHGKNAAGGHYTAAVRHANPFGWVNFDDNIIKTVNVNQVLKHHQGCVPYLLFYEKIQTR